ncbi:hypothetical protein ACMFMG_000822 [Clarireedia jacksonii]
MPAPFSLGAWYPKNLEPQLMTNLADESYNAAVKYFCENLTMDECKRIWLSDKHTINDVQQAIEDAKSAYEAKEKHSKTHRWIQKFSSRVLYYADIFDTLSQHHPEYVSLVWGAIKFVFVGVINHGELVTQLSKALSYIADVLPHVELKSVLYPTKRMSELVAIIYSQIIRFVIRAINWYKEGKLKHILTSITRPYALRFKDLLDDLATSSRQLDQLAVAAAMMEQRDMHLEQKVSHQILLEVRNMIQANHGLNMTSLLDTNKRVCDIQVSQILAFTASSTLQPPETTRKLCSAMRNRRRFQHGVSSFFAASPKLQEWSSMKNSSHISISGSYATRHCAQDFAVDVIGLISESKIPVIWILNPTLSGDSATVPTTIDILKHLVLQILQLNQHRLTEKSLSLSATQFQCAKSDEEWFDLLVSALMGLPLLYIVVDLEVLKSAPAEKGLLVHGFLDLVRRLSSGSINTVMKIAFISYFQSVPSAADIPTNEVLHIPKATNTMYKSGKRNKRQTYTNRNKTPSILKLRF